jgi:hypothetical protein
MAIEKVCVRIPAARKDELLAIAKAWRETARGPGWDAKIIHQIAKDRFGGLLAMFEHHDWPERGSDMMRFVQSRVKETYGSVDAFAEKFNQEQ